MRLLGGLPKRSWRMTFLVPGRGVEDRPSGYYGYQLPWWVGIVTREYDQDAYRCAPLGLHLLLRWWLYRKTIFFTPLIVMRLWRLKEPGGSYTEGRPRLPWGP